MIKLVYSPNWFCGKDIVIDVISLFVLICISAFAVKCYKINKSKNYLAFSVAFILLALSFLFKIMTNFTLYYTSLVEKNYGIFTLTYEAFSKSNVLVWVGFLGYFFFGLMGLMSLWRIYKKDPSRSMVFLMTYFILLTAYLSMLDPFVFHLTSLVFLVFITSTYWRNYRENRSAHARLLAFAFVAITLSHLIFVFNGLNPLAYVVAELFQLTGYLMLFGVFFRIIKNGKKK